MNINMKKHEKAKEVFKTFGVSIKKVFRQSI